MSGSRQSEPSPRNKMFPPPGPQKPRSAVDPAREYVAFTSAFHLRSLLRVPAFVRHAYKIMKQADAASGIVGWSLASTFSRWTSTRCRCGKTTTACGVSCERANTSCHSLSSNTTCADRPPSSTTNCSAVMFLDVEGRPRTTSTAQCHSHPAHDVRNQYPVVSVRVER